MLNHTHLKAAGFQGNDAKGVNFCRATENEVFKSENVCVVGEVFVSERRSKVVTTLNLHV